MQLSLEQALREGIRAHKGGKFQEADKYYTSILKVKPKHPDANHNMGVLAVSIGRVKEALPFFEIAIEANPDKDQFWLSYIETLIKLDRPNDARTVLNKAKKKKLNFKGFGQLEQRLKLASAKNPKKLVSQRMQPEKLGQARKTQDPPENLTRTVVDLCIQKQFQKAKNQSLQLLLTFPNSIVLYNILGAANQGLGELENALNAYKKAISIKPNFAEAHYNLANVMYDQGNLEEAILAFKKAIALKPNYFEAFNNMGNALQDLGKLEEAIQAFNTAIRIKPNFAEALNNMGVTFRSCGKLKEAIQTYNKALLIRSNYVEVFNNKGNVYKDQGKLEKAINEYKKAISFRPNYYEAWSNGADALEKWNRLEQLESWLGKAFLNFTDIPSDLKFYEAKLHWRQKRIKKALSVISKINIEKISQVRQQDYLNLRAKCLEQLKDFDGAFKYYSEMNSLAKKSRDYQKSNPEKYFNEQCNQLERLKSDQHFQLSNIPNKKTSFSPVFLVGFPRSGTTLLDTILRSHSKIDVVEERLSLSKAKAYIQTKGFHDTLDQTLPKTLVREARSTYQAEFKKHIKDLKSKAIHIDKMPLNILEAPLIHQLYPEAKFILALRHPMDTVLSCWMQNFKLNPAMANMTDLDRIVEFYCIAMETLKISRAKFRLDVYELKYENLLDNLTRETSSLLSFLNLTWEQEMKNYRNTAIKRERINTPSYSQVIQPIYKDSKYKWLNYKKFINKYMTKLKPWIQEFGYK